MSNTTFIAEQSQKLPELMQQILTLAREKGMDQAEVSATAEVGFHLAIRNHKTDTLTYERNQGASVTVYKDHRTSHSAITELTFSALKRALETACEMVKFTTPDPFSGLADSHQLAKNPPLLPLFYPWDLSLEHAKELALQCFDAAAEPDLRLKSVDSAEISTSNTYSIYGNSAGFLGGCTTSIHSLSCVVIGQAGGEMQRDVGYTVARDPLDLKTPFAVALEARENTFSRLNAKPLKTQRIPVVFDARIAYGFWRCLLSAISGGALYQEASFLLNQRGEKIFPSNVNITEDPFLPKGLGSTPFDAEGVRVHKRALIQDGILMDYMLDTYSARKLNRETTGNAGGAHNVIVDAHIATLSDLLKTVPRCFLVTELIGQGINIVTGDYSRGAAGFWVENGVIEHAVQGVTIAGNLKEMFKNILYIAGDIDPRHTILTGSVLVDNMMVASQ